MHQTIIKMQENCGVDLYPENRWKYIPFYFNVKKKKKKTYRAILKIKNELEKSSQIKTLQLKTTGVKQVKFWRCLQVSDKRCCCRSYGPLLRSQYRLYLEYPSIRGILFVAVLFVLLPSTNSLFPGDCIESFR